MGRDKNLQLGAINITIHPHTKGKQEYIDLFKEFNKYKRPIEIQGQYYGVMNKIEVEKDDGYIFGKFYRFTEINPNSPWLNLKENNQILDDEGNPIPQVEEYKKPNSKEIYFYFIIQHHRLVFDSKAISPNFMKKFLEKLLNNISSEKIQKESVTIIIEQSEEKLEELLSMYYINEVSLTINKPNPDEILGQNITERLNEIGADTHTQTYKSKNQSIIVDDELKSYMKVAISNGLVNVKGKNEEGKTLNESTKQHPLEVKNSYNTNNETYLVALKNRAFILVNDIMEKFKR